MTDANTFGWGMWMQGASVMQAYNTDVGKSMNWWCGTVWFDYQGWDYDAGNGSASIKSIVDAAYANNAEPLLLWSWDMGKEANKHNHYNQNFIDGDFDEYLDELATHMAADGRTIHFRFFWEMSGRGYDDCGWAGVWTAKWYPTAIDAWNGTNPINTPATFKAAWRHVVDRFRLKGATNVKFWFTASAGPGPGYPGYVDDTSPSGGCAVMSEIYPGDEYVDYLGYEFYTPINQYINTDKIRGAYLELCDQSATKPIIVAEIGVADSWYSTAEFAIGSMCIYGGKVWTSLKEQLNSNGTTNHVPASGEWWSLTNATYTNDYWGYSLDPAYIQSLYPRTSGIVLWNDTGYGLTTTELRALGVAKFKNAAFKNGRTVTMPRSRMVIC